MHDTKFNKAQTLLLAANISHILLTCETVIILSFVDTCIKQSKTFKTFKAYTEKLRNLIEHDFIWQYADMTFFLQQNLGYMITCSQHAEIALLITEKIP